VAKALGIAWKLCQVVRISLPLSPGDCVDLYWCVWTLDGFPWGKCAPLQLENWALVIPSSESTGKCLKLIAPAYCELGQKGFPRSDLMIARESQMCPSQVSHSQCPENAPLMIPPSESDEKPGKICVWPASQLDRRGISELSINGTSRSTKPPQKLRPLPEQVRPCC
jgi:hypothetical protein